MRDVTGRARIIESVPSFRMFDTVVVSRSGFIGRTWTVWYQPHALGMHRDVVLAAGPQLWSGHSGMDRPNGNKVRCAVRHSIDYTAHVVTIGFPRSCVSNPRWVRLGVGSFAMSEQKSYLDDALLANRVDANTVVLSPRLKRG